MELPDRAVPRVASMAIFGMLGLTGAWQLGLTLKRKRGMPIVALTLAVYGSLSMVLYEAVGIMNAGPSMLVITAYFKFFYFWGVWSFCFYYWYAMLVLTTTMSTLQPPSARMKYLMVCLWFINVAVGGTVFTVSYVKDGFASWWFAYLVQQCLICFQMFAISAGTLLKLTQVLSGAKLRRMAIFKVNLALALFFLYLTCVYAYVAYLTHEGMIDLLLVLGINIDFANQFMFTVVLLYSFSPSWLCSRLCTSGTTTHRCTWCSICCKSAPHVHVTSGNATSTPDKQNYRHVTSLDDTRTPPMQNYQQEG